MTETVTHELARKRGAFRIAVLNDGSGQANPPCAAIFGKPGNGCLVRVQSRCVYGEIFESTNCDCSYQLRTSLKKLRRRDGVLVYLDQEGRGAGLLTKAQGYELCQEKKIDTFAAYAQLDCPADSRSYDLAAALLRQLGLEDVRLMTNNPAKVKGLEDAGITVRREPLVIRNPSKHMYAYLTAKVRHQHHELSFSASVRWWFERAGRLSAGTFSFSVGAVLSGRKRRDTAEEPGNREYVEPKMERKAA